MKLKLPISAQVPLAMGLSALLAAGVGLLMGTTISHDVAWEQAERASESRLAEQGALLAVALARGDRPLLEGLLSGLRADPRVRWAAVVAGDGVVLADLAPGGQGLPAEAADLLARARAQPGPTQRRDVAAQLVHGAVSLGLDGAVLLVDHDAGPALATVRRGVRVGAISFASLLMLSVAAVGFSFHRVVARRVTRVLEAAGRIAGGDFAARTGLEERDELGQIGLAVDEMANQLEQRRLESNQSEQRYRRVFEQAADAIFLATPEGRYEDVNAAGERLLGFSREELLQKSMVDLVPPEDLGRQPLQLQRLKSGHALATQRRLVSREGERIPVEISASVLADGRLLGLVRDLRPQREAERLREQVAVNERLAVLGTLAASVGHELNNPLTWLLDGLGAAEALAPQLPAQARAALEEHLADARNGAERVARIVADLRIFSRSSGQDAARPIDPGNVVRTAINLAGPALRDRAEIALALPALPAVMGDERKLCQVLLNLLSNAVQAMPRERPASENRVRVAASVGEDEVRLEVEDNGQGIAPEILPRIFEPYFSTKPPGVGSGLGLSICRDFMVSLGGGLEVESEPGKGATFTLRLRRASVDTVPTPPPVRPEPAGPTPRLKVLVIDDEPLVARSLARLLAAHEVTVAPGPLEGLALCRQGTFDRIFCDLSMPAGGGQAFFEGLRAERPELLGRVAFLTGGAATAEAAAFLESTRQPVLYKPFDAAKLRALLGG